MNLGLSLFRLQNLDTTIAQIHARIHQIDNLISDTHLEKQGQVRITEAQNSLKSANSDLKIIQDQVDASRLKLKFNQSALFGGKISNSKDLQDLEMEAQALRNRIASLEEEQFEAMVCVEAANSAILEAEKSLADLIARRVEDNAAMLGEKMKIQGDLPDLIDQQQAILNAIPAESLSIYQSLLRTKNGLAVVEVIENACTACGYELAPADQQAARSPSSLLRCKTCGRILYKS